MGTVIIAAALHFCSSKLHFAFNTDFLASAFGAEVWSLILPGMKVWFKKDNENAAHEIQLFCTLSCLQMTRAFTNK